MRFLLLGPFEIVADEPVSIPRRRERCVLAVLLLEQGRAVAADRLTELLWDGDPPPSARTALRSHISRLRSVLDPEIVQIGRQGHGYALQTDPERVDVHRFRTMVRQARELPEPDRVPLLRSALELWRGPVLADIATERIRDRYSAALDELRLEALDLRVDAELSAGRHRELITELREVVAAYPNQERFTAQLMLALYRCGRQTDALHVFDESRRLLDTELGVRPGPELRQLHQQILRADPVLDLPERVVVSEPADLQVRPRQLPHDIANFTGRDAELKRLSELADAAFERGDGPAPTIISIDGAPGTGKTTLAVHWAHQIARRGQDVQLYLNLRGYGPGDPLSAAAATETLLRGLGVRSELIPPGTEERSALLRSTLAGQEVLMLLDNARDADQVRPLLPASGGLVVVTSRNQLRGLSIRDGAHRVTLRKLPEDQAVELLATAIGRDRVADEPAAAARLAQLCDHLPLALAIVAEHAHRARTLAEVVGALGDEQARLDNLGTGAGDPHTDVRAALSWSYQALDADAAAMFRKLGLHPGADIGLAAAAALADLPVGQAKAVLDQLVAAHLVEQPRLHTYELHDLIRLYATDMATTHETATERDAAIHRILDWYLHAAVSADRLLLPHRRRDFLAPYEPLRPPAEFASATAATTWFTEEFHLLRSITRWAAEHGWVGYAWRLAVATTTFLDRMAPFTDGIEFFEIASEAARSAGDVLGTAYTCNSLGALWTSNGDHHRALAYIGKSLEAFRELAHERGEAMALGNLGLVYAELKDHDAAQKHFMLAFKLCERLVYPRGTVMNLDNLGVMHAVAGEYRDAVACHRRADTIIRMLEDPSLDATNQHHLGSAYAGLGSTAASARAFRLSIRRYYALGNRRWVAIVLTDYGHMLHAAGHPGIARRMWEAALVTMRELGDPRAQEIKAALAKQ